jgi:hypothetical protein
LQTERLFTQSKMLLFAKEGCGGTKKMATFAVNNELVENIGKKPTSFGCFQFSCMAFLRGKISLQKIRKFWPALTVELKKWFVKKDKKKNLLVINEKNWFIGNFDAGSFLKEDQDWKDQKFLMIHIGKIRDSVETLK